MKTSRGFGLALSAVLLLGPSAAAIAAPARDSDVVTKTVRFDALDVSTASGAQKLYERITAAAHIVCREVPQFAVRACRTNAVNGAVSAVGSPLLSSIHRSTAGDVQEVVRR